MVLVESGKLKPSGLTTMLRRKLDRTDYDGAVLLLANGGDPNPISRWGRRALHLSSKKRKPKMGIAVLANWGNMIAATEDNKREPGNPQMRLCEERQNGG